MSNNCMDEFVSITLRQDAPNFSNIPEVEEGNIVHLCTDSPPLVSN